MSQVVEIKRTSIVKMLDFFRVKVDGMSGISASNYRKAVACLRNFINEQPPSSDIATTGFLENWFVFMFFRGLTAKTSFHYFDIVAGLYGAAVKEGKAAPTDVFVNVKAWVKRLVPDAWTQHVAEDDFRCLLNVTKVADRLEGETALAADILLFSLLNRGMDFSDVAKVKRDELASYSEECRVIAERHLTPRRKYVFPLGQSKKAPEQTGTLVSQMISRLFFQRNIKNIGNAQNSVRAYWAYAALRCGVSAASVIGTLGCRPIGIPVLGCCTQIDDIPEGVKASLTQTVADVFISNPTNWYAMRLRPRVSFGQVKDRISGIGRQLPRPELFYPCDEIARKLRKKVVYEEKPVLPDIVFFKSRMTYIQPLLSQIGDLAWCYTSGGSYAPISSDAMVRFQQAIGKFTPDYEVGPVGSIRLRKGDKVVVIGGLFKGLNGEILEDSLNEGNVVYRIKLWGDNNDIEWRVSDRRLIEKQ